MLVCRWIEIEIIGWRVFTWHLTLVTKITRPLWYSFLINMSLPARVCDSGLSYGRSQNVIIKINVNVKININLLSLKNMKTLKNVGF